MMEKLSTEQQKKFDDISANYELITRNIALAAEESGRKPSDITLLAATKTVEPVFINHA